MQASFFGVQSQSESQLFQVGRSQGTRPLSCCRRPLLPIRFVTSLWHGTSAFVRGEARMVTCCSPCSCRSSVPGSVQRPPVKATKTECKSFLEPPTYIPKGKSPTRLSSSATWHGLSYCCHLSPVLDLANQGVLSNSKICL